ncbi:MAG: hypothetical protein Ct9H90mP18_06610 [Gammaproteobacteria bacterium]|nr:MAG: hypothetical protein Ct9H90mP18_06610 [Gammaproteobacteria bacterium]
MLKGYICDTRSLINKTVSSSNVIFEGAQGTMLDVDHGTYPFLTSSIQLLRTIVRTGMGQSSELLTRITKAYTTRVGHGPFPSELKMKLVRIWQTGVAKLEQQQVVTEDADG